MTSVHAHALHDLWDLHRMALYFHKVEMIAKQGYGAKHAVTSWQSPFWQGIKGSNAEAFSRQSPGRRAN